MTDEGRLMYVYLCGCGCGVREGRRVVGRARVLRGDGGWERDGEILQNWYTKVIESFIYKSGWQAGDPGKKLLEDKRMTVFLIQFFLVSFFSVHIMEGNYLLCLEPARSNISIFLKLPSQNFYTDIWSHFGHFDLIILIHEINHHPYLTNSFVGRIKRYFVWNMLIYREVT